MDAYIWLRIMNEEKMEKKGSKPEKEYLPGDDW